MGKTDLCRMVLFSWLIIAMQLATVICQFCFDPCNGAPVTIDGEGKICFPLNSSTYDSHLRCQWTITAPLGTVIKMELNFLDIESCSNCACDYLTVYNGADKNNPLLEHLCGSTTKTIYSQNNMYLEFISDHTIEATGFLGTVTFQSPEGVAFHAVRYTPEQAENDPIRLGFDEVTVNIGGSFDIARSEFHCPITGHYYFNLCAGAEPGRPVNMILNINHVPYVSALRTSTSHSNIDMLQRGVIIFLDEGDNVHVTIDRSTSVYSDPSELQTSFTGFILPFVNDQDAILFAAKPDNITNNGLMENMDKVVVNIGDWGTEVDTFIIPQDGVYFLQANSGCHNTGHFYVRHNGQGVISIRGMTGSGTGTDTCSGGVFLDMDQGDEITLYMYGEHVTNNGLQISLSSFLAVKSKLTSPMFSVARTNAARKHGIVSFNTLRIEYDWEVNIDSGLFTCQKGGVYFVYINVGQWSGDMAHATLNKNSEPISALTRLYNNSGSLSKALLVQLEAGDTLSLELIEGELYSGSGTDTRTVFSVFLLYEN